MDLWTEDELYELAKRVHPPRRPSPPALKLLCLDFTINRWKEWVNLNKQLQINPFDNMAPLLRNDLIDRLIDFHLFKWPQHEFLILLLNTQTKSLILDHCMITSETAFHRECPPFVAKVVSKAPNLECLSFYQKFETPANGLFTKAIKTSILTKLVELKKLQRLNLFGYFVLDSDDLMLVTRNLKNLVILEVLLGVRNLKVPGFQLIRDLKKLEEFHFAVSRNLDHYTEVTEWVYSWCAQNLPRLKLIGDTLGYYNLLRITPAFSGTSSLETLHTMNFLPQANLPNIKHLGFSGKIKDSNFFSKLCSYEILTTLVLNEVIDKDLDQILEVIGSRLSHLCVLVKNYVDYYKIFHFCQNLAIVKLEIDNNSSHTPVSKFKELISGKNFLRLVDFKCSNMSESRTMPVGLLSYVLQAPLVKKIELEFVVLTKEDCIWLRDVVEGRFQKLESVIFECILLAPGCKMKDFKQLIKFLVCGAHSLKEIICDWCEEEDGNDWEMEQSGVIKFMELLCNYFRYH